ncbi:uncharacterized protein LOC105190412 [Harpegnathos saltator]|uniref:uncharacterized protein LOC105190412 n=1 Tax=Harpegnathos saltator TaxID=610380 RepID=UPI000DBEDB81|nr:uncharacterized protein LOC105190412 [Harpegnathos saltator]XP_025161628.1 uncharacterized protein LOC105190412 [Harpegnathos saltator]
MYRAQASNKLSDLDIGNCQGTENFHRFVVETLISLKMKVNAVDRNVKLLLHKRSVPTIDTEEGEDDIFQNLPVKSDNELEVIETKLKNDSTYRKNMIKQLVRVVCEDLKTSCIRLMRQIFSNELAMEYS